jgi:hypothetical protein
MATNQYGIGRCYYFALLLLRSDGGTHDVFNQFVMD